MSRKRPVLDQDAIRSLTDEIRAHGVAKSVFIDLGATPGQLAQIITAKLGIQSLSPDEPSGEPSEGDGDLQRFVVWGRPGTDVPPTAEVAQALVKASASRERLKTICDRASDSHIWISGDLDMIRNRLSQVREIIGDRSTIYVDVRLVSDIDSLVDVADNFLIHPRKMLSGEPIIAMGPVQDELEPSSLAEFSWSMLRYMWDAFQREDGLRSDLHRANLKYRDAAVAHRHLVGELNGSRTRLEEITSKFAALAVEATVLRSEGERLASENLIQAGRISAFRSSLTFKIAREVRISRRSWTARCMLPLRLLALLLKGRRGRADRHTSFIAEATVIDDRASHAASDLNALVEFEALVPTSDASDSERRLRPTLDIQGLNDFRVAAIMDEFSEVSFSQDCSLQNLNRTSWRSQVDGFQPHLLFVESAWRGADGSWHNAVSELGPELRDIVSWCNERSIPTVFWNKEDPVHFSTFLTAAAAFDHVFTTDMDSIPRYKSLLGHGRVHLLPFAVQPKTHHPIEEETRAEGFAFAGAYYKRYPERTKDLESFVKHLPALAPFVIFDRNLGASDPNYKFPEEYDKFIVGTLAPAEVQKAYKGYEYAINLNSVKQSQSMFARRVFELIASNTHVVSNFSRAVQIFFGATVTSSDSGAEIVRRISEMRRSPALGDSVKLAALRNVLRQHTYADRLRFVIEKVFSPIDSVPSQHKVALVGVAASDHDVASLMRSMCNQQDELVSRHILLENSSVTAFPREGVKFLALSEVANRTVADCFDESQVALIHTEDHYGPNYVTDMLASRQFSEHAAVGKSKHFARVHGGEPSSVGGQQYSVVDSLPRRAAMAGTQYVGQWSVAELIEDLEHSTYAGEKMLALDYFNYCRGANGDLNDAQIQLVDGFATDTGVELRGLQEIADSLAAASEDVPAGSAIGPDRLGDWFDKISRPGIAVSVHADAFHLESTLEDGAHDYIYARGSVPILEMWRGDEAHAYVDAQPGLNLQVVFIFHDDNGDRIEAFFATAQRNSSHAIPPNAAAVKIGMRVSGPGRAEIRKIALVPVQTEPAHIAATARQLVVTNHYPSYDDLYRNGFIHSRVRAYAELGLKVDVFRLRPDSELVYSEFESVPVMSGSSKALELLLESGQYDSILFHFLDESMWDCLSKIEETTKVLVWIHGAEVQPWWRRAYNYRNDDELEAAKAASDLRIAFWKRVFADEVIGAHFIFVSEYFASEVMEDVGIVLDADRHSIIHNPIDVGLFEYHQKPTDQRLKILSIRPFASPKYANDLSVAALVVLSDEEWFEELEILIVGDGPLFDSTLEPLREYPNVELRRGFLKQAEIASLHRDYGVFLVPTRMDAQGVSRDEAMASGLVPVTTRVAAVPEFVDSRSGFLAEPEDAQGLAQAITTLREDPELFKSLSQAAAARVRSQSESEAIIRQELALILADVSGPRK